MRHDTSSSTHATPYLIVRDAAKALAFYPRAFGAVETLRLEEPGGRIGHAEISIGGARLMLADEHPDQGCVGPETLGNTSVTLALRVDDVDAFAARAVAAGATLERPVSTEFYGERVAKLRDPFGHRWSVSTVQEDVSPDEMKRRFAKLLEGG